MAVGNAETVHHMERQPSLLLPKWAAPVRSSPPMQLHVVFGAGRGDTCKIVFDDIAMGVKCSSMQW